MGDILERIERIEAYTQDGRERFLASLLIQDGVIRSFEVIGEAVKQISSELDLMIDSFGSGEVGEPTIIDRVL